ncbi:MAG: hypothetical protein RL582_1079 [Bacteroidota bacterium]|jgi:hypothetical protein
MKFNDKGRLCLRCVDERLKKNIALKRCETARNQKKHGKAGSTEQTQAIKK